MTTRYDIRQDTERRGQLLLSWGLVVSPYTDTALGYFVSWSSCIAAVRINLLDAVSMRLVAISLIK
jgi:hypothetical protein